MSRASRGIAARSRGSRSPRTASTAKSPGDGRILPSESSHHELLLRVASAAVAGPLVVSAAVAGSPWFTVLLLGVAATAVWELRDLQRRCGYPQLFAVALASAWAFPISAALGQFVYAWAFLGFAVVGGLTFLTLRVGFSRVLEGEPSVRIEPVLGWGLSIALGLYVGTLLSAGVMLRDRQDGIAWVLLVLAATWVCDITAYFVGKKWGRRRLAPRISPQKSVEGALAGLFAAVLSTALLGPWLGIGLGRVVAFGIVVGCAAILGDLVESALKRGMHAKDSGWILPGHGGILDRADSLVFAAFVGYWYVILSDGIAI